MQTGTDSVRSEGASPRREHAEPDALRALFDRQRAAHRSDPSPGYEQRIAWLDILIRLVAKNRQQIADAINADFGSRSWHETQIAEVFTLITGIVTSRSTCAGG
jgi:coniferyl-aldehyde dehydrogenase